MTSTPVGRRPTGPRWYWYTGEYPGVWEPNHYDGPVEAVDNGDVWLIGEGQTYLTDSLPGDFAPLPKPVAAPEPDWTSAPEWAMWWAVDANGAALWWETEPYAVGGMWERGQEGLYQEDVTQRPEWQDTLRRRPEVSSE